MPRDEEAVSLDAQVTSKSGEPESWQSRAYMKKLLNHAGMFAEPDDLTNVSTLTVGLATRISGNLMLVVCVHPILFADVSEVGHRLLPDLSRAAGDDDSGLGLGWRSVAVYERGAALRGEGIQLRRDSRGPTRQC